MGPPLSHDIWGYSSAGRAPALQAGGHRFDSDYLHHTVGAFNGEGPPVPIPNTEVKLASAEDTCLETDWENRSVPTQIETARLLPGGYLRFADDANNLQP